MTNINIRGGIGNIIEPDTNARPQDNLYLAVNSEWLKKAEIPSDRSRTGSFDKIDENLEKQLMKDFSEFAKASKELPEVKNFDKAVELYKIANNFEKRNADGAKPIQLDLKLLEGLRDLNDFNLKAADLTKAAFTLPFNFSVQTDMKNTKVNALHFSGPGLFLPDTTVYKTDSAKQLLDVFAKQSVNLLHMAGIDETVAKKYVQDAISYDARLAEVVKSTE
ncbi:MAG: M13 family peptidase, partial [Lactobacillus iners]|nr:M13 family peptidase [Lactobacillus iners]